MDWSGTTEFCKATRTAGRILPAAHPHTEFTTTIVVPGWASAASTSSAVRVSLIPARVNSSRIGMTMTSGYIKLNLALRIRFQLELWIGEARKTSGPPAVRCGVMASHQLDQSGEASHQVVHGASHRPNVVGELCYILSEYFHVTCQSFMA